MGSVQKAQLRCRNWVIIEYLDVGPDFTYLIRAAGEEQEEKTGPKSDLLFLRYRAPNIEVYM